MFREPLWVVIAYLSRYSITLLAEQPSPCRIKSCFYSANSTYWLWSLSKLLFRTPRSVFTLGQIGDLEPFATLQLMSWFKMSRPMPSFSTCLRGLHRGRSSVVGGLRAGQSGVRRTNHKHLTLPSFSLFSHFSAQNRKYEERERERERGGKAIITLHRQPSNYFCVFNYSKNWKRVLTYKFDLQKFHSGIKGCMEYKVT